jgi:hypothetical protein
MADASNHSDVAGVGDHIRSEAFDAMVSSFSVLRSSKRVSTESANSRPPELSELA